MSCRTPLFAALAANFINLALDLVLIFVLGMGVAGAAIATTISQVRLGCRAPSPPGPQLARRQTRAHPACQIRTRIGVAPTDLRGLVSSTHLFAALRFARES